MRRIGHELLSFFLNCSKKSKYSRPRLAMLVNSHNAAAFDPYTKNIQMFFSRGLCPLGRDRTYDRLLKRELLYQLSYEGDT